MLTREQIFRKAELIEILEKRIRNRLPSLSVWTLTCIASERAITNPMDDDAWDVINELRKLEYE